MKQLRFSTSVSFVLFVVFLAFSPSPLVLRRFLLFLPFPPQNSGLQLSNEALYKITVPMQMRRMTRLKSIFLSSLAPLINGRERSRYRQTAPPPPLSLQEERDCLSSLGRQPQTSFSVKKKKEEEKELCFTVISSIPLFGKDGNSCVCRILHFMALSLSIRFLCLTARAYRILQKSDLYDIS